MFIGQAWHRGGIIPLKVQQSILKMQHYCADMSIEHRFRRFDATGFNDAVVASDTFRNQWAVEDSQLLWADCDVEFSGEMPEFEGKKPYFAWLDGRGGWCNGIFYANGNAKFFDQLQRLGERRKLTNKYFWGSSIMNTRPGIVEPFPKIYSHSFLTTGVRNDTNVTESS